jgi:hypothetical protein
MRIRYMLVVAVGTITLFTWLIVILIASSRKRVDLCPHCRSYRVRPSWPTIFDKILNLSALCAFRCEACLTRFYARKSLYYGKAAQG